ncbi:hypothetical protein Rhopal_006137-T1 [Rhodotorula paludigena]|uniref:Uncharacterized protein n=1 Tax=Rhodotorula paludigena TaxID=86838 RepID=A0AAV5GUB3_9BASI|nr:hypothetical protein Rhopal_006137-T1 [Rhodotorula paludigena]
MVAQATLGGILGRTLGLLPLDVRFSSIGSLWQGWRKSTWDALSKAYGTLTSAQTEQFRDGVVAMQDQVREAVKRGQADWYIIWNLPRPDDFLRDYCKLELNVDLKPWALARKVFFEEASDLALTARAVTEEAHLRGEQPDYAAVTRHHHAARRESNHDDDLVASSAANRPRLSEFAHEPSTRPAPSRPHHPDAHNRHSPERQLSFGAAKHYRVDKAVWEAGTHRW